MIIDRLVYPLVAAVMGALVMYAINNRKPEPVDPVKVEGISKALYSLKLDLLQQVSEIRLAFTETVDDLDKKLSLQIKGIKTEMRVKRGQVRGQESCPKEIENGDE